MGFCCGAGMIGATGTIRHNGVLIHNVPLVFCPVCQKVDVHSKVSDEFELFTDYAKKDGVTEVNFQSNGHEAEENTIFSDCLNMDQYTPLEAVAYQIDMALDLFSAAQMLKDQDWCEALKNRLRVLSDYKQKLEKKKNIAAT